MIQNEEEKNIKKKRKFFWFKSLQIKHNSYLIPYEHAINLLFHCHLIEKKKNFYLFIFFIFLWFFLFLFKSWKKEMKKIFPNFFLNIEIILIDVFNEWMTFLHFINFHFLPNSKNKLFAFNLNLIKFFWRI